MNRGSRAGWGTADSTTVVGEGKNAKVIAACQAGIIKKRAMGDVSRLQGVEI
jgi:hypothetical protein